MAVTFLWKAFGTVLLKNGLCRQNISSCRYIIPLGYGPDLDLVEEIFSVHAAENSVKKFTTRLSESIILQKKGKLAHKAPKRRGVAESYKRKKCSR